MALDDECRIELHATPPTDEVVQCARHMVKIIGSLSTPDCDHIFTAISLMLVDVIANMDWPSQQARDMIPDLIALQN